MKKCIPWGTSLKKLLFAMIALHCNPCMAQRNKQSLNIFYDNVLKSNMLEYHSVPFHRLLDTVACYHGYKAIYKCAKPIVTDCGELQLDLPINSILSYDLRIDENYDDHNDIVFTIEDSIITFDSYYHYQIDSPAISNPQLFIDVHYDPLRRSDVLEFKNADPTTILNMLAALHKHTIIYKIGKMTGRSVTGLFPLNMAMTDCLTAICVTHKNISRIEKGKEITIIQFDY